VSTEKHGGGVEQAQRMLDTLASMGVRSFDVTLTDLDGHKQEFRSAVSGPRLRSQLPLLLAAVVDRQQNLIVRPRGSGANLIQLDDLDGSGLEHVRAAAFLVLMTSPGNHQAWVAVRESTPDFARRLRQGSGADLSASGATRIAGSANFKRQYAPNFPTVHLLEAIARRIVTQRELEALGLAAPPQRPGVPSARVSRPAKRWPSYERCLQTAPLAHRSDRRDVSRADFTFCLIALDWGWSPAETCERLLDNSGKAREQGEPYARLTVQRAHAALQRRRAGVIA